MSSQPGRGYLGISEVLAQLRSEFPDVSVSKIRFLETEGLIAPARAPSGFRRFAAADVERLRYILTAQRDQYLPLRVIRERLASGESQGPMTRRELLDRAGITDPQLTELETYGLLRRAGRMYGPDALEVARTAGELAGYGVQPRHLRPFRAAVEREVTLIEGVVAPLLKQHGAGARESAVQTAGEIAALAIRLHGALIDGELAEAGLGGAVAAGQAAPAGLPDSRRRRGVAGASA
jgi:DNA-binding transcriptional MerR regulator